MAERSRLGLSAAARRPEARPVSRDTPRAQTVTLTGEVAIQSAVREEDCAAEHEHGDANSR